MNFRGLEALCAFVQAGSVLRAAERLGRTPPQVGRLLNALEADLGFPLFDRTTRPLELTREGRNFALQAQTAMAGVERLDKVARQLRSVDRVHVRILTAPFLARAIVIDAVAALAVQHPELTVELDSRIRLDIEEWIENESFDLGISSLPVQNSAFRTEELVEVDVVCAMRKDHPLAARDVVEFEMLADYDLTMQHPRSAVRSFIESLAQERGQALTIRFQAPNGFIAAQMAAGGLGCSIADPLIASSVGEPGLVMRPFRPKLTIRYGFVFPTWIELSPLTKLLCAEIRQVAQKRKASIGQT
ncbi:LysR family transcriptional regulator [Azorhizobium sp. AG788]|uniref:LysR family transcriptional regulator n=1 Tax=Azorhizobium sp. AG788 TaxID=2183897 RepID=UPI00313A1636